jgi:hypothetical protein
MISWKGRHLKIGECPFILWSYLGDTGTEITHFTSFVAAA